MGDRICYKCPNCRGELWDPWDLIEEGSNVLKCSKCKKTFKIIVKLKEVLVFH